MLSNVSRTQPRARLLQARQPSQHQILAPSSSTLLQSRHRAQARGIRLGRWTPKRGADCRGDASSHPRAPRYRYIASINRTVSWDQHPHFQESKAAIKNLLNRYWDAATAPASTDQYADPAKVQSWSDELAGAGARPGQNIEDVERSAINHLFESHNNASSQSSLKPTTSATQEAHPVIDPITNRRVPVDSIHSAAAPSAAELRRYSRIPIDAKPWVQSVGAKSYADLDNYQSVAKDSLSATTVTSTTTPKYDDLEKYKPTDFSDALQEPAPTPKYDDLYKYGPVMYMEGMKPREDEPKYDDLHKYKPFMWREPDGLPPLTAEERSKQYGDLRKYGPVQWREPDGLPPLTAEEESKKYEDLHTYGPVAWNEPDGLLPPTAEELSKQYADLHLYEGPFTFNEPHGQLPPSAEELSKQYTDLHKYDGPFTFNEPHGQLPPSAEELSKNYTDLHAYKGPVTWNEPDGKMPITAEEASKQYTDLDQYGGKFEFNEPDGQLFSTSEAPIRQYDGIPMYGKIPWKGANGKASLKTEEGNKQYDDLDKYGKVEFNEPDGKLPPTSEELSKNYNDLHKYGKVEWNEPNGKPAPTAEERSKQYTDLDNYGKVEWNEPNGKPSPTAEERSKKYTDLDNYGKVEWNEPNGKPALTPEERSKHYTDLCEYGKVEWNEPHGKPALTPEELSKRYGDLHRYKGPYQHNEPHGKPAELSSSSIEQEDLSRYKKSPYSVSDDKAEDLDLLRASDVRAAMTSKMAAPNSYSPHAEALEKDMSEYARAWEAANKVAKATIEQAKIKSDKMEAKQPERKLTGNYVRDFPEDFKVSWSSLLGQNLANSQANNGPVNAERPEEDIASFDESFPTLETTLNRDAGSFGGKFASPKIEPALNRGSSFATVQQRLDRIRAQADPYSREPQGLELSYAEECAATKASAPSSIRTYKTVSDAAAATSGQDTSASQNRYVETKAEKPTSEPAQKPPADTHEEPGKGSPEPSHYKILAYDPTMQSVMTADTTSIVPDSAAPLTPPEVMQRLSNPIKFFPHLAPLQQQGYEIVSGSGDVLVFRKVREGRPISQAAPAEQTLEHATYQPPRVNPIDMMGSQPVIPDSFSASPTGYASYDIQDTEPAHKPPPPFRSTLRAQDYGSASQGSSADEKTGRTKKSRGKKIILGAVWVGGMSYAVGVIGEYFHTGGANGTGQPTRV